MASGVPASRNFRNREQGIWIFLSIILLLGAVWFMEQPSSLRPRRTSPMRSSVMSATGPGAGARPPGGDPVGARSPMEALAALMRSRVGSFGGRLLDGRTGEPLRVEAEVVLEAGAGNFLRGRTNSSGEFLFDGFPYPTPVRITITNEEEGISHVESLFVEDSGTSVDMRVSLCTLLRGRIEGPDGRGLPGATVAVACYVRDGDSLPADEDEVLSDAEGRFQLMLGGVWGGLRVAGKVGPGWQAALGVVTRPGVHQFEALIRTEYCWTVRGEVVDREGRPLENARVVLAAWKSIAAGERIPGIEERRLLGSSGIQERSRTDGSGWEFRNTRLRSDSGGRFEGSPLLPAERVYVAIHKEGYPPKLLEIDTRDVQGATDRVSLGRTVMERPDIPLKIRLRRENGDPVVNVPVSLQLHRLRNCGVNTDLLRSDGDGWIQSDFLAPGTEYVLVIHDAGVTDMSLPMPVFVAQDGGSVVIPNPGRN